MLAHVTKDFSKTEYWLRGMIEFTDLNGIRLLGGTKFPSFGEILEFTGKSNREI